MIEAQLRHSRIFHVVGLFVALTMLTAGRPLLQGARQILLPMETNPPVGKEFKVKAGDTILASRFMNWNFVRLEAPTSVAIDRFSQVIGPDIELEGFGATRASSEHMGLKAQHYYCADKIKAQDGLSYQLVGSITSNVEQFVRFCFADENSDGRFDHIFLLGAKSRELQDVHEIEPVAFHMLGIQPDKKDTQFYLILARVETGKHNLLLYLRPQRNGKEPWIRRGPFTLWSVKTRKENPQKDKVNIKYSSTEPVKISNIMGYDLTVKDVNPATGEVVFVCDRTSDPMFGDGEISEYATVYTYVFY